jgi:4-amino-4-deoxy-L-arabinose transferase-like glycosyltransferase
MRRRALWLLFAVGAALRLGLSFSRPSLSIDETMTSLEIGSRSFAGLMHPLAYAQTAPPLFLWGVKLCTLIGGMNEYALRVVPLIGGLLVPYLVWRVGQRVLDPAAALLATGIAGAAPTLVQYSVIAKPYMTDAVIALVLAQCTLRVLDNPGARGAWAWLGIAGLAAVLGSIAAPFLLGGVGVALLMGLKPRTAGSAALLAALASVWGVVFILLYASLYRPVATSSYMQQFWSGAFLTPLHISGWELVGRAVIQSLVARPIPAVLIPPVILLILAGFAILARRAGRAPAALLGISVLAELIASPLHRYPLSARVLLGVAPTLALCAAAGLVALTSRRRLLGAGVSALVVVGLALVNILHPYRTPALRPAIRAIAAAASGDPVYISSGAIPAWAFYTIDWSSPDTGYLGRIRRWGGLPDAPGFHNLAPRRREVTVADAADSAVRRLGRMEILGLAPGIQWREVVGLSGRSPDAGWAATEAARIKQSGPTVWLLIATAYADTRDSLFAALDGVGARIEVDSVVGGVERSRVGFARHP